MLKIIKAIMEAIRSQGDNQASRAARRMEKRMKGRKRPQGGFWGNPTRGSRERKIEREAAGKAT